MSALPEPATGGEVADERRPANADQAVGQAAEPPALAWLDEDVRRDGVRQRRFDVVRDGRRIPGLLWSPEGVAGPVPLVLLGHGGSGSKRQDYVFSMARRLSLDHGIAAAAIDGPVHGDRRGGLPATSALVLAEFAQLWANDGDAMTDGMVGDVRATLDALGDLPEIDATAAGWWGVSMGTIVGIPAVASDPRFRVAVFGLMGLTGPTKARIERDAPSVRCPTLFLVQWDDAMFPHDTAIGLWEALGARDKRLHASPGDHGDLPADAFGASALFLARHLAPGAGRSA